MPQSETNPLPKPIRCDSKKYDKNGRFPYDHSCKHPNGHDELHECSVCGITWNNEQEVTK